MTRYNFSLSVGLIRLAIDPQGYMHHHRLDYVGYCRILRYGISERHPLQTHQTPYTLLSLVLPIFSELRQTNTCILSRAIGRSITT
jgi:hypothetical protein